MFEMKRKFLGHVYRDDGDSSGGFGQGGDASGGGWGNNGYGMSGGFGGDTTGTNSGGGWSNNTTANDTYGGGYGGVTAGDTGFSYGGFGNDTNSTSSGYDWGGLLGALGNAYNSSSTGMSTLGTPTSQVTNSYSPSSYGGFDNGAFGTSPSVQSALGQLGATQTQGTPQNTGWGDLGSVSSSFAPTKSLTAANTLSNGYSPGEFSQQGLTNAYNNSDTKAFSNVLNKIAPYASFVHPMLGAGLSALGTGVDAANRASYGVTQNGQSLGAGIGSTLGNALGGPLGGIAGKAIGTGVGGYSTSGDSTAAGNAAGKSLFGSLAGVLGSSAAGPVGGYAANQLANAVMNNAGPSVANTNGSSSQNPGGNTMLGQLANLYFANQAANSVSGAGNALANSVDPNGQFRNNYAQQLNNLVTNPSSILSNPAYKMQYDLAMQNATRSAALGGGLGNGGAVAGIANAASTAASNAYQSQLQQLANLANGNGVSYQAQLANQQAQINARNVQQQNYLKLIGQLSNDMGSWFS